MRIDEANEPKGRRLSNCALCAYIIKKDEKRITEGFEKFHIKCYVKELNRHLKWFDKVERSGLKWRAEKEELMDKFGSEIVAEEL